MSNWTIRVQPEGKVVEARPGESLLTALKRGAPGVAKVGCQGGGCGLCRVRVVSGEVTLGPCSVTASPLEERQAGLVLACKAYPRSDLVVERGGAAAKREAG